MASYANEIESKFIEAELVDFNSINGTVQIDLVNSDPAKKLFSGKLLLWSTKAYLGKEVAIKLSEAQKLLKVRHKNYFLQILDAARLRRVSRLMYDNMRGTNFEKYVANPKKGSMYNYGIAVDLTIVDETGKELDLGFSPFRRSTIELYWMFLKKKLGAKLSSEQIANRTRLADEMSQAGFIPLGFEC